MEGAAVKQLSEGVGKGGEKVVRQTESIRNLVEGVKGRCKSAVWLKGERESRNEDQGNRQKLRKRDSRPG